MCDVITGQCEGTLSEEDDGKEGSPAATKMKIPVMMEKMMQTTPQARRTMKV